MRPDPRACVRGLRATPGPLSHALLRTACSRAPRAAECAPAPGPSDEVPTPIVLIHPATGRSGQHRLDRPTRAKARLRARHSLQFRTEGIILRTFPSLTRSLHGFPMALQAVALFPQEVHHRGVTGGVSLDGQFTFQAPGAPAGPQQRRFRVASGRQLGHTLMIGPKQQTVAIATNSSNCLRTLTGRLDERTGGPRDSRYFPARGAGHRRQSMQLGLAGTSGPSMHPRNVARSAASTSPS